MLSTNAVVFVCLPEESNQRVLHAARVTQNNSNGLIIRCDEAGLVFEAGQQVRLYFEKDTKFVQQVARIDSVVEPDPSTPEGLEALANSGPTVVVRTLGDPASAEGRECFRVSTITAGLDADLGTEQGCVIADISATGFSLIARSRHTLGTVLPVCLYHEGNSYTGDAAIQSIKDLGRGRFRYGFLCAEEGGTRSALKPGLRQISAAVQRRQLKRISGAAA